MRISDWSSDVCSSDLGAERVMPFRADDQIAFELAVHGRRRTFGVGARGKRDARDVDEAVALDARVRDLMVTVDHRIGHAVHHRDRALERAAREPREIIVATGLVAVDEAPTAVRGPALGEGDGEAAELSCAVA